MDLALNNLQRLICYKTQETNQSTNPNSPVGETLCFFYDNAKPHSTRIIQKKLWISSGLFLLYIDLRPGQICHSKVMHRKEVTHSDGSYERKSPREAWLKKLGKEKIPWYTHRLMHRKRVTSELHDSYFRLMTIKHAIPKIEWAIEWAIELLYNSVKKTGSQ